jgi:hypothetical protein
VFFRDTAHGFLAWALATVIGVMVIAMGTSSVLNAGGRAVGSAAQGAAIGGAAAANRPDARTRPMSDMYFVDMLYRPAPASNGQAASGNANATAVPTNAAPTTDQGANAAPAGNGAPAMNTAPSGTTAPGAGNRGGDYRGEATRIFIRDLPNGDLTPDDRTYLAQSIAMRTGMSQADAQKRVDDTVAQVKAAETKAQAAAEKARKAAASGSIIGALAMLIGAFIASVTGAMGGRLRDEYHALRD